MKRKLKTWEKFEREFKPLSDTWEERYEYDSGFKFICIKYNGMHWHVYSTMKPLFGTEIQVRKYYNVKDYTHHGYNGFDNSWHELWFEPEFEPIDFLSKKEVEI